VTDGEGRDHRDEADNPAERNDEAEQKQKMVDAAQDVLDTEPDEPEGRLVLCRIKRHTAGRAVDHHRPTGLAEWDVADRRLDVIAKFGAEEHLYRKHRFG
jgi:hypothetical protein